MDLIAKDTDKFETLKTVITNVAKFNCSHYTDNFLKRRIEVRLRYLSITSYLEYSKILEKSPEEIEKLKKELTIHTTNFFRDSTLYSNLIHKLFPEVAKINNATKKIRVWSAGASTGEEALSIAICFYEALGEDLSGYDIEIVGTDRDIETVKKAERAIYEEPQFREMPVELRNKYFTKTDDDLYHAKSLIKKLIKYETGDILARQKENMDIIFCRNTVIYFDIPTKSKLYEDIYKVLPLNGFFIMGKTEIMQGAARDKFKIYDFNERIYQKCE